MRATAVLATVCPPSCGPPLWFPFVFVPFFLFMWVLVTTLLGLVAGHGQLLARFPPAEDVLEQSFTWTSGMVRGVRFNSAMYVGLGSRGLHLAPNWLFRSPFQRGIPCIPWNEVRLIRSQSGGFWARLRGSKLEVPAVGLQVTIRGAAGRAVEQKLATVGVTE